MKLSSTLLQAIALGVSVTAVTAATTSCEKQKFKENKERSNNNDPHKFTNDPGTCPACGMG